MYSRGGWGEGDTWMLTRRGWAGLSHWAVRKREREGGRTGGQQQKILSCQGKVVRAMVR